MRACRWGLLCVSSAQGQVIREEGFPVKGGVAEESAWAPVVQEECDPFTVPGEFGESCAPREKTPDPFGFGPEGEARPGEPSGPAWRTPPRLECPVAVFLEELETGQVECHAWDASGEEHLEYSWEPVGSTTRDYLNNPRLIPEDSPTPSVVAPETPAYETLESFYSGETTFLYRYRLTATSRATGLSSWREVEVYVSGSRPSVYCPLEVAVEEGEAIALDCEGADPLSHRMDYDEDGASIEWLWEGLWGTSMAPLAATDLSSALFTAPAGSAGEEYHYIASMTSQASGTPRTARRRVTVRVVGEEEVSGYMLDPGITCSDSPYEVYEGASDLGINCSIHDQPAGNNFVRWSRRGEQILPPASAAPTPRLKNPSYYRITFDVPDLVNRDEMYEYTVALYTSRGDGLLAYTLRASADVAVTVKNKPAITITCEDPDDVDEGADDIEFDCSASGAPGDDPDYTWSWSPTDDLTGRNTATPTFDAPDDVDRNTTWTYTVTASAENADDGAAEVRVTVLDTDTAPPPSITCSDAEAYEGTGNLTLDCSVANEPTGATYAWAVRGSTSNTNDLSSTTILQPTFAPPGDIDEVDGANKDYEYTVTMTAGGVEQASEDVIVTVLEKPDIYCSAPRRVVIVFTLHESTREFPLRFCPYGVWTGAPGAGAVYAYAWTALSSLGTANTDLLSAANIEVPTFYVPDEVESDLVIGTYSYYSYMLTVSAENADDASVQTQIKVPLSLTCADSEVYEGADDITLDCSVTNAPSDAAYSWTGTDVADRLSGTDGITPTFSAPGDIDEPDEADKDYYYTVTMTVGGVEQASEDVTVTVLEKPDIYCPSVLGMLSHFLTTLGLVEGSRDYPLRACASGWEGGPVGYTYAWTARNGTPDTALLSAADIEVPTFDVPDAVDEDERYSYTLTVSAANADDAVAWVDLIVWDIDITVMCESSYEVYEGSADIELECEASGAPRGSSYTWSWSPNTRLTDHDTGTPTFAVPGSVEQDTTYTYAVTATAENADDETANVTVTVLDTDTAPPPSITCNDSEVYEGAAGFTLDCTVTNAPSDAAYSWTGTDVADRLTDTSSLTPTFVVPGSASADTDYDYTVTLSAAGIDDVTADVMVTVLNKEALRITCAKPTDGFAAFLQYLWYTYEGDPDFEMGCLASGAPGDSPQYTYVWTEGGDTPDPAYLSAADIASPTFYVPDEVAKEETYYYTLTVSAENAESASADVTVIVRDRDPSLTCADSEVYEGADDITLDCSVTNAPSDAAYSWTGTDVADRLSGTDGITPTFAVPVSVSANTDYEYTVTLSVGGVEQASEDVTVTVLNKPAIDVDCAGNPYEVYEGSGYTTLDCSASGAPSGSAYDYVWTARGSPPDNWHIQRLSATDISSPTFRAPPFITRNVTYEYRLTVSAENAKSAREDVTVTVLDRGLPGEMVCDGTYFERHAGSDDIELSCRLSSRSGGGVFRWLWAAWTPDGLPHTISSSGGWPTGWPRPQGLTVTGYGSGTFRMPATVNSATTYKYTLGVWRGRCPGGCAPLTVDLYASQDITIRVLPRPAIAVTCADPDPVYEGSADIELECEASGAPSGSSYTWLWSPTDRLTDHDTATPTFDVPYDVPQDTTYTYTVTASAENAEDGRAEVTVTVLHTDAPRPFVTCNDTAVYEGAADITLDCSVTNAPSDAAYSWAPRGSTSDTNDLIGTAILAPMFDVPDNVDADTDYDYTVTLSASGVADVTEDITVTVLNRPVITVTCADPGSVYEGSADFALDCAASGAPAGSEYTYVWTGRGSTTDTALLSAADIASPTFYVPDEVAEDETYEYALTVSAENAESASANVTVQVLNKKALDVACATPSPVYEGSEDFALDCSASGAPAGSDYAYEWTARGGGDTSRLSSTTVGKPTFYVPDEVAGDETYEYLLTVSAENADPGSADVTVTVLNKKTLDVACATPSPVYEGSEDFALDCAASGAPAGSAYVYAWTARGGGDTSRLSSTTVEKPTFAVPEEVDEDETYEYTLTVSAENAESATAEVTVKVLNLGSIALVCASPPLVYEGSEDFALDCSISGDTGDNVDYTYEWTAIGSTTNTDLLSAADIASPTFYVPDALDETTTYEYLLTARAENAEDAKAEVTVTVLNKGALAVICADPGSVYEGSEDFAFDCSASGAPAGSEYTYEWTGRGSTTDTALLSAADIASPTFYVPDEVAGDETYEYRLTVSAENAEDATAEVTVTVLNRGALALACADPGSVYEGSEDFAFDCSASGAPAGSAYEYAWTARGSTTNTALLSAADVASPTFYVPEEVDEDETYEYTLTVSAENAESATAEVTVKVLNLGSIALVCASPPLVYEGSEDFALDCAASGAPGGSSYEYAWTARNGTANTARLSAADIPSPTFSVPEEVDATTTYEYLLTASAENAESATAEVTVKVLNLGSIALVCASPPLVYEGSEDFAFDCSASGAPGDDAQYTYVWTARGDTPDTSLLSAADVSSPMFHVPEEVDEDETYEYTLTVSADNAESVTEDVTVTVLNKEALAVACADPGSVYEGSEDFALDCSISGDTGDNVDYTYAWTAIGATPNTSRLSAADIPSPMFDVPEEVDATTTYEYLLTARAANAEDATAEVTVTVLNRGALALACADPGSVYEGSEDITFDCSASGAPGDDAQYTYAWTARGDTPDTALLSAVDVSSPMFYVPDEVDEDETYEYTLTASAENAEDVSVEVTVTVLNKGVLALVCADPGSVYEGSEDFAFDCSASGAPGDDPQYTYAWTARGDTPDTALLSNVDIASAVFAVPDEVDEDETYEYTLTVSADNAESVTEDVTVTVLNKEALALACADPGSVYEGSADIAFDCSASGAPGDNPQYTYAWTARGDTPDTSLLSAVDVSSPMFYVPDEVDEDETYEYTLTVSADNAEFVTEDVTVTVLNKEALALACADPGSVYEGSADIAFDCSASGAPGDDPQYTYAWTARGDTPDTALLSAADVSSPMFYVPEEVDEDETYEYTLTVSADNAEFVTEDVTVTVLDRIRTPALDPVSPPAEEPPADPLPAIAESSSRAPSDPTALGVTVSASSLRFGVQSSQTEASLDPLTDGISTRVSGPYHAGRMALSPGGGASFDENGEMDLSIEVISPVLLKREDAAGPFSLVLSPSWSYAESCEQLSSQAIGGLYTEATLAEGACRLLRFGGELDLTDAPSGRYAGSLDVVLRSGEREETHSVEVEVTVVPSQRVITIGPGGVSFSTSRELAAGLTEDQSLSIYPDVAFLTEGKPHGVFELSNPSLVPLEVSVSARFGYTEATRDGREVVVEDASGSHLGDLSQVVDIHPAVVVLQPGEKGLVRYGVQEGALAAMAEKGYAAFFDVVSAPRQYVRSDRMPEEVTGERTARVTMRVPGVYVPGDGASQLRARLLSLSYGVLMSATFLLETQDRPFVGEVVAYDGQGRELGRRETLVYTRSRVRVPLARMPEEEVVFLRFSPRGSGRVPDPVNIPWNAPGRDIGAAGEKERRTTPKSALQ